MILQPKTLPKCFLTSKNKRQLRKLKGNVEKVIFLYLFLFGFLWSESDFRLVLWNVTGAPEKQSKSLTILNNFTFYLPSSFLGSWPEVECCSSMTSRGRSPPVVKPHCVWAGNRTGLNIQSWMMRSNTKTSEQHHVTKLLIEEARVELKEKMRLWSNKNSHKLLISWT